MLKKFFDIKLDYYEYVRKINKYFIYIVNFNSKYVIIIIFIMRLIRNSGKKHLATLFAVLILFI
jgi:hypothetical protein